MKNLKRKVGLICMLTVVLPDKSEVDLDIQSASVDATGNLTISAQKLLKDTTTGESVPDGPVLTLTEAAGGTNAGAVATALETAAQNLYAASIAPASGSTTEATS